MIGFLSSIVNLMQELGGFIYDLVKNFYQIAMLLYSIVTNVFQIGHSVIPASLQIAVGVSWSIILTVILYKYITRIT